MQRDADPQVPLEAVFLSRLPDDPEVQELARLFEAGNYRQVRKRAAAFQAAPAELRLAVAELKSRTQPAPLLLWLLILGGLLLTAITVFAWGRS